MLNWKNLLLDPDSLVEDAIKVLDRDDTKIVLVVDEKNFLLGTVTDGDIRRGLLRGLPLTAKILDVMNCNPRTSCGDRDRAQIKRQMEAQGIRQIPIVDENGRVKGLETLKTLTDSNIRKNPILIMAGGLGTRLRPLTETTPKPMLKIGGKPILEHILDGFIRAGFYNFYISTHYKAEIIKEYFGDGRSWGVSIKYVDEKSPLGTAGALRLLPSELEQTPIIVINGDILTNVNYSNLIDFHDANLSEATVCVKDYEFQVPYGVVESEQGEVKKITEKPVYKFFVNTGLYVMNPASINYMAKEGRVDMTTLLEAIIKKGKKVSLLPIHENWLDIGRIEEFNRAQNDAHWLGEK
jgi:dTDP-glucose pyrophosphorylase